MAWYPIGPSSYPDLRGQQQYTNSARIAAQFLSMKWDFDRLASSQETGRRLSANEARRSRPRQQELYANYLRTGYPIAAYPYTSRHDEILHGNAIDVGITLPDGSNTALNDAEFAWMHWQCELRGFTWTGVNFGEPWHIEGATRAEQVAPYPWISVDVAFALTTPPPAVVTPAAPAPAASEENVMHCLSTKTNVYYDIYELTTNGTGQKTHAVAVAKATRGIGTLYKRMTPAQVAVLLEDVQTRREDLGYPRSKQIDKQIEKERA